jgi:hypothetical protein
MLKSAVLKEMDGLVDDLGFLHDKGVGIWQHYKIGHPLHFGAGHRDFAVVWTRYQVGQPGVEEGVGIAGNHPNRIVHRAQLEHEAVGPGAQLLAGRPVVPLVKGRVLKSVGDLAALVGGLSMTTRPNSAMDFWDR